MKYYLTEQQWMKFWMKDDIRELWQSIKSPEQHVVNRYNVWNMKYPHIKYVEYPFSDLIGYWGILEGKSSDITWFILQI